MSGMGNIPERKFLLTCLLRGMTFGVYIYSYAKTVSTHMPLARHDRGSKFTAVYLKVSTHMPLARHDLICQGMSEFIPGFYSHASCEA